LSDSLIDRFELVYRQVRGLSVCSLIYDFQAIKVTLWRAAKNRGWAITVESIERTNEFVLFSFFQHVY